MKLLLLEDNVALANSLGEYLEGEGCEVDYAYSGNACLTFVKNDTYDVIILDITMPGINGLDVCKDIRQKMVLATPVLFLTARDTLEDKIVGFKSGGDDYLVKPFSPEELFYRLKALNARGPRRDLGIQTIGDIVVDYSKETVTREGQVIPLLEAQFRIVKLLAQYSPNVVPRETIETELWGENIPDSDSLRTHMYRLRNQIDKPFKKQLIKTIHGRGYRLDVE